MSVSFRDGIGVLAPAEIVETLRSVIDSTGALPVADGLTDGLKFSRCLPRSLGKRIIIDRFYDMGGAKEVLG